MRSQYHNPLFAALVPDYFGIAEIANARVGDYGVALVFGPGTASVVAVRDGLVLKVVATSFFARHQVVGKHGNHRRLAIDTKSTGVFPVDDGAARKNVAEGVGIQSNGQIAPIHQILAHCVRPVHGTPYFILGVMLIKQVVFSLVIDHAIGVVHPHLGWGEMELGAMGLVVVAVLSYAF